MELDQADRKIARKIAMNFSVGVRKAHRLRFASRKLQRDFGDLLAAFNERRQKLVRFIEGLWDKYRVTLGELREKGQAAALKLTSHLERLGYQ